MIFREMTVRLLGLMIVGGVFFGAGGCNTMEGVGEDTQKAGEKIEDAANDNK